MAAYHHSGAPPPWHQLGKFATAAIHSLAKVVGDESCKTPQVFWICARLLGAVWHFGPKTKMLPFFAGSVREGVRVSCLVLSSAEQLWSPWEGVLIFIYFCFFCLIGVCMLYLTLIEYY